jgi:Fe-S cluster assembly protein SufD
MQMETLSYISEKTQSFLDRFKDHPHQGPLKSAQKAQEEALGYLQIQEAPTTRSERWKYSRIARILNGEWTIGKADAPYNLDASNIPEFDGYSAVFINGNFNAEASKLPSITGVSIMPMSEAVTQHAATLEDKFASLSNHQREWFEALNTAYANNGLFVHAAKGTSLDKPLRILQISSGTNVWSQVRHFVMIEESCKLELVQHTVLEKSGTAFTNGLTEAFVSENASLRITQIQDETTGSFAVNTTWIKQLRDSRVTVNTMTLDGDWVRNDLNILVDGENCETHMNGVYMPREKQHVDNHTMIDHLKPHCTSYELYKGIVTDKATAVFNGKVFVRQDAQLTNAFQQNANILLDDDATMYSKPELEIYADDVKCSHGSTTGQFDEEAVFYLRARGLGELAARKLLVSAFVSEALELVENEALEAYITERLGIQH